MHAKVTGLGSHCFFLWAGTQCDPHVTVSNISDIPPPPRARPHQEHPSPSATAVCMPAVTGTVCCNRHNAAAVAAGCCCCSAYHCCSRHGPAGCCSRVVVQALDAILELPRGLVIQLQQPTQDRSDAALPLVGFCCLRRPVEMHPSQQTRQMQL
jgi:hypothetical protein